jgi:hypothetical protein
LPIRRSVTSGDWPRAAGRLFDASRSLCAHTLA